MSMTVLLASLAGACDGYKYRGMDGNEARRRADAMPLEQAYAFYIETYKGVRPPMLDVAGTLHRFGPRGEKYLVDKATGTADSREFEAIMEAMMLNDTPCSEDLRKTLSFKASALDVEPSTVALGCHTAADHAQN